MHQLDILAWVLAICRAKGHSSEADTGIPRPSPVSGDGARVLMNETPPFRGISDSRDQARTEMGGRAQRRQHATCCVFRWPRPGVESSQVDGWRIRATAKTKPRRVRGLAGQRTGRRGIGGIGAYPSAPSELLVVPPSERFNSLWPGSRVIHRWRTRTRR